MNHARIKYWSPDAQLAAVKQRLKHLVAARRYNAQFDKHFCIGNAVFDARPVVLKLFYISFPFIK